MTRTLSEADARELIHAGSTGHLGCIVKGEPYVVPINYLVEDGMIYSHSLPGTKIRALRVHPRACLQVEDIDDDFHWRSAIAFGVFGEVQDALERGQITRKIVERFPTLTPVESHIANGAKPREVIVFRIRIERVTGVAED